MFWYVYLIGSGAHLLDDPEGVGVFVVKLAGWSDGLDVAGIQEDEIPRLKRRCRLPVSVRVLRVSGLRVAHLGTEKGVDVG